MDGKGHLDSLLQFRCKRFPICRASINFIKLEGGGAELKSTQLKHSHAPDWTESCKVDREVWAVLTHPKIQQKLNILSNKKKGIDPEQAYYIAEEVALCEDLNYSCVSKDQFALFIELYHSVMKNCIRPKCGGASTAQ